MKEKKEPKILKVFTGLMVLSLFGMFLLISFGSFILLLTTKQTLLWIPLCIGIVINGYGYIIRKKFFKVYYLDVWWRSLEINTNSEKTEQKFFTPTIYDDTYGCIGN